MPLKPYKSSHRITLFLPSLVNIEIAEESKRIFGALATLANVLEMACMASPMPFFNGFSAIQTVWLDLQNSQSLAVMGPTSGLIFSRLYARLIDQPVILLF